MRAGSGQADRESGPGRGGAADAYIALLIDDRVSHLTIAGWQADRENGLKANVGVAHGPGGSSRCSCVSEGWGLIHSGGHHVRVRAGGQGCMRAVSQHHLVGQPLESRAVQVALSSSRDVDGVCVCVRACLRAG